MIDKPLFQPGDIAEAKYGWPEIHKDFMSNGFILRKGARFTVLACDMAQRNQYGDPGDKLDFIWVDFNSQFVLRFNAALFTKSVHQNHEPEKG